MLFWISPASAQRVWYVGASGGISTLSADGRSVVDSNGAAASSYKPSNGFLATAFAGVHLTDYLSTEVSYTRNRNDLILSAVRTPDSAYEERRDLTQNSFAGDVALHFRGRRSWVRPFLAIGLAATGYRIGWNSTTVQRGSVVPPQGDFSGTKLGFRAAAGIDLAIGKGWSFRYCFLEVMQANPISPLLSPQGERRMADFRNLFGIVKTFRGK